MEAKDLMIGDWVLMPDLSYGRITQISEKSVEIDNRRRPYVESIRPIKLDTRNLLLIGFEQPDDKSEYMIGFFGQIIIGRTPKGDFYIDGRGPDHFYKCYNLEIEYVHQLQHLFRFLGIRDDIKL